MICSWRIPVGGPTSPISLRTLLIVPTTLPWNLLDRRRSAMHRPVSGPCWRRRRGQINNSLAGSTIILHSVIDFGLMSGYRYWRRGLLHVSVICVLIIFYRGDRMVMGLGMVTYARGRDFDVGRIVGRGNAALLLCVAIGVRQWSC